MSTCGGWNGIMAVDNYVCSVALSTGVCMTTSVVYDNSHSEISSMQLTLYKWLLFNLLGDSHLMQLH